MKDRLYDRVLVGLAVAGPLLMVVLGSWQSSLSRWYVPPGSSAFDSLGAHLSSSASQWIEASADTEPQLVVIVDRQCPCTEATLRKLDAAVAQSGRSDLHVRVRDIHEMEPATDVAWRNLVRNIPATPTLLTIEDRRLIYAGPVTSGSFCSTAVAAVLGVTAVRSNRMTPIVNLIDRGCYCPAST